MQLTTQLRYSMQNEKLENTVSQLDLCQNPDPVLSYRLLHRSLLQCCRIRNEQLLVTAAAVLNACVV